VKHRRAGNGYADGSYTRAMLVSILSGVFLNPAERAKAIGIWSAVSGHGIAAGPTLGRAVGRALHVELDLSLINLPLIARRTLIAGRMLIPASRAPRPPRLDLPGAALSVAGLGALTYMLIQAPDNGSGALHYMLAMSVVGAGIGWPWRRPPSRS
jgi:hypothetical protein